MDATQVITIHVDAIEPDIVGDGIAVHRLYRSGPEPNASRALLVRFPPGAHWPGIDVHEPGPEDLYVVSGVFSGLTGEGSVHGPGSFIHLDKGTGHSPSSTTGGELFVYYPHG